MKKAAKNYMPKVVKDTTEARTGHRRCMVCTLISLPHSDPEEAYNKLGLHHVFFYDS